MPTTFDQWQHAAVSSIFNITLDGQEAESSGWEKTYLKELAHEIASDSQPTSSSAPQLTAAVADQILIARLSLDPAGDVMSDDADHITMLASLPKVRHHGTTSLLAGKRQEQKSLVYARLSLRPINRMP